MKRERYFCQNHRQTCPTLLAAPATKWQLWQAWLQVHLWLAPLHWLSRRVDRLLGPYLEAQISELFTPEEEARRGWEPAVCIEDRVHELRRVIRLARQASGRGACAQKEPR